MYYAYPPTRPTTYANQTTNNKLKVTGEGKVSARPDQAIITLGVITENINLRQAQSANAESLNNVIQALLGAGIPKEKLRTTDYRIDLQYDYKEGEQIFRGYRVTNMLAVTVDNMENVGRIVDLAVESGANTVSNIKMVISNEQGFYNQALSKAIINAQEKAELMAKTIGVSVNKVPFMLKEMVEQPDFRPREMVLGVSTDSAPTPIVPGMMEIKAQVEAEFSY